MARAGEDSRDVLLTICEASGRHTKKDIKWLEENIRSIFKGQRVKAVIGLPEDIARRFGGEFPVHVLATGDGGTNHYVNGLMEAGTLEGITLINVPWGSGNDFPKALNIPKKQPLEIAQRYSMDPEKYTKLVDIERVTFDGKVVYAVNIVGLGLTSAIGRHANAMLRKKLPTLLAYGLAIIPTLIKDYNAVTAHIKTNGVESEPVDVLALMVNNGAYGGGMMIPTPEAEVDDGELNMLVVRNTGRARLLYHFPKIFNGTHGKVPSLCQFKQGARFDIALRKGGYACSLDLMIDGELMGSASEVRVEVIPKVLRVAYIPQ
jgi:diacylglycerol kinase family enzyme